MCTTQSLYLLAVTVIDICLFSLHVAIYSKFVARLKKEHRDVWFDLLQRRQKTDDGDEMTVTLQKYLYFGEFTLKCNKSLVLLGRIAQAVSVIIILLFVPIMYIFSDGTTSYSDLQCLFMKV
jgi:hypothetical protein